ncbi:MAG: hypothetical protein KFF68_12465 [Desulfosarcina sp.]|nr:hypothetical protein [Desulfosarcina sp.]
MGIGTVSRLFFCVMSFLFLNGFIGLPIHHATAEPDAEELLKKQSIVYRIIPEKRGGEGFKLIYLVPVPVDVFWRFKTDFRGNFLLSNKYIQEHRLIYESGNVTVTENRYANAPNETFRWRTTLFPDQHRLDFRLENPRECGHRFHYGSIRMEPFRSYTKVTHTAYFDFFGAYLWANLRIGGGMTSFLMYTARWEKEAVARSRDQYEIKPVK